MYLKLKQVTQYLTIPPSCLWKQATQSRALNPSARSSGHKIQTFSRENQYCVSLHISDLTTFMNTIILSCKRSTAATQWTLTRSHQGGQEPSPGLKRVTTGTAPTTHTQTWEDWSLIHCLGTTKARILLPQKPVFICTAHPYAVVIATQFPARWSSNWTPSLEGSFALCLRYHLRIQFNEERTVQIVWNLSEHFRTFFLNTKAKKHTNIQRTVVIICMHWCLNLHISLDILNVEMNLISNFRHITTGIKLTLLEPHLHGFTVIFTSSGTPSPKLLETFHIYLYHVPAWEHQELVNFRQDPEDSRMRQHLGKCAKLMRSMDTGWVLRLI